MRCRSRRRAGAHLGIGRALSGRPVGIGCGLRGEAKALVEQLEEGLTTLGLERVAASQVVSNARQHFQADSLCDAPTRTVVADKLINLMQPHLQSGCDLNELHEELTLTRYRDILKFMSRDEEWHAKFDNGFQIN